MSTTRVLEKFLRIAWQDYLIECVHDFWAQVGIVALLQERE